MGGCQEGGGIGADRVERHVSQVEQAGEPHDDVEAERQDRERCADDQDGRAGPRDEREGRLERAEDDRVDDRQGEEAERGCTRSRRLRSMPRNGLGIDRRRERDGRGHVRPAPTPSRPAGPVGRKTSTRIRIEKTITLVHFASRNRSDIAPIMPMSEPPEGRAGQVADAAQHGGRERQQAELEPELEPGLAVVEGHDQARRAGEGAGDQEGQRDRPVDVDAHEARRLAVLGGRPHRLALACASDEPAQQQQERDGHADDDDLVHAEPRWTAREEDQVVLGRTGSTAVCDGPSRTRPTFCRTNDMPIALIKGATRGALRSGR